MSGEVLTHHRFSTVINHLWAFDAERCAHARTAEAHAAGNYDRAKSEHYAGLKLAHMANEACTRAFPFPADDCDEETSANADLQRWQCNIKHSGVAEVDFSEWFYRTWSDAGRWALPEWRDLSNYSD